jgi:hypothetical protein
MTTNRFLTGVGLTVVLMGCGSVSGIPIEKTATDFAKTICPKAYSCCMTEQLKNNKSAGTTEAECETLTADDFRKHLNGMQASENAGRSKFDQKAVDDCLSALRAAECSELTMIRSLSGLPACNSTFATPLVPVGGKCGQDYECIDSVCQKEPMAWEGVCAVGASAGASCATDHCAQDLSCNSRGTDDASDNVCVAEQEVGGACVDNFDCKSRVCAAASDATAKTCMAPTTPQCFYGGGCSAAGGAPRLVSLLVISLFVGVALARSRRARSR